MWALRSLYKGGHDDHLTILTHMITTPSTAADPLLPVPYTKTVIATVVARPALLRRAGYRTTGTESLPLYGMTNLGLLVT
jgi:hypothetical protein